MIKKAIVLLSGGLDSTTVAKIAMNSGFEVYALSFSYGQRHEIELEFAKKISKNMNVKEHKIVKIDLRTFGGSALTDEIDVPKSNENSNFNQTDTKKIPITYVPARNTIFLSYALAYAEVVGAFDIFIGVNAIDYSGYPDCRPEFIATFEKLANLATAAGVKNSNKFKIHTPLIKLSKKEIIELGIKNGVDYSITHSCYDPIIENEKIVSCGKCDSCKLRLEGFRLAGIEDELEYF